MKQLKRPLYQLIIVSFNILLVVVVVWAITLLITQSPSFYAMEFIKNNTPNVTGYTMDELKIISEHIIDYLFGHLDTMQVVFEDGNVFSNQALNHMRDVRTLYNGGSIIGWIALAIEIGLGTLIVLHYQYLRHDLLKTSVITIAVLFGILAIVGILSALDFDRAFEVFHHIIFPDPIKFRDAFFSYESYYPEDPGVNNLMLVMILSEQLFMDVGLLLLMGTISALIIWIIIILLSRIIDYKKRGKTYVKNC